MKNLLIIDDNEGYRSSVKSLLTREGYSVDDAPDGISGLEKFREVNHDLVLTDLIMENIDGLKVVEEIKKINSTTEVILITAYGTVETAVKAIKAGAYDYVTKESKIDEVILAIERAMEKKKLADKVILFENELKSKYKFEEIIGNSTQMMKVLDTVSRVCKTDSTILITGNSGTGKELIGKAIHYNSLRDGQSLVIINSVAIPDNLHESELFGHKKGAFTGALYDKKGLIEEAEGGTLILDEVGDLAMSAQVKLLRFLQSKEIRMVGENIHKKVDVRIIAMTNRDLKADVRNKTFREDLFFRLNVIPIHIPPLQERNRDIMLLIDHILEELKERLHKPNLKISRRAVLLLNGYTWPGNVRELENVLERSSILCDKDEIGPEDLPVEISGLDDQESLSIMNEDISLQEVEKKYIIAAWKKYQGNKSRAAAQLEISRGTLINKLRQYGIE